MYLTQTRRPAMHSCISELSILLAAGSLMSLFTVRRRRFFHRSSASAIKLNITNCSSQSLLRSLPTRSSCQARIRPRTSSTSPTGRFHWGWGQSVLHWRVVSRSCKALSLHRVSLQTSSPPITQTFKMNSSASDRLLFNRT